MPSKVYQYTSSSGLNLLHGQRKLVPTVTSCRPENVSCKAFRVHSHKDVFPISYLTLSHPKEFQNFIPETT
uniref:Uncharacterized protein n=1 Tax=Kalanchoe fedtschenkoi TaxID=63787 RepID=A0A7N0UEE3_KALFE